jgi:Phage protein (N4 Gp49/phage Sf6 gene 66) family
VIATNEKEVSDEGLAAPRVTPEDVQNEIESEFFFTADDGVMSPLTEAEFKSLSVLTLCVLILKNGFTVTGESACASFENFDAEIGRKIARKKAEEKIWPMLGFRLRDKLASGNLP